MSDPRTARSMIRKCPIAVNNNALVRAINISARKRNADEIADDIADDIAIIADEIAIIADEIADVPM